MCLPYIESAWLPHSLIMMKNRKNFPFLSGCRKAFPAHTGPLNVSVD